VVQETAAVQEKPVVKKIPDTHARIKSPNYQTCGEKMILVEQPIHERYCVWSSPMPASVHREHLESIPQRKIMKNL